jgi:hypothetical protein
LILQRADQFVEGTIAPFRAHSRAVGSNADTVAFCWGRNDDFRK